MFFTREREPLSHRADNGNCDVPWSAVGKPRRGFLAEGWGIGEPAGVGDWGTRGGGGLGNPRGWGIGEPAARLPYQSLLPRLAALR